MPSRKKCPNKSENLKDCPCCSCPTPDINERNLSGAKRSWPSCPRKGNCCECVKHHREAGDLPACLR